MDNGTTDDAQTGGELAEVHYLPATTEPDDAIDGEIVTDEEYARLTSQKARMLARYQGYGADLVAAPRVVKAAWKHDRTKTVVTHVFGYPIGGAGVVIKHWRDTHGANRYERQMRLAEAGGDEEKLRYWELADVAEKDRRHKRMMDWLKAPKELVKAAGYGLAGLAVLLLVIGVFMAVDSGRLADIIAPVRGIISAIAFAVWFLTAYGVFLLVTGTVFGLAYLYQKGKRHAEMPQWLLKPVDTDTDSMDELPDEGTIVNALKNLGIPGFNKALKEGWRIKFLMPPVMDGKGWRCQIALPPACTVEEIVKRKKTLAHNLVRFPIEVWPTEPQPSVLDLWVAKPGALSGPVDPWPLLEDLDNVTTDYFTGVPVGVTIKGDMIRGRLSEANYVVGGMMGSGKSTMVITLLAGAMLDPLVDIDVVVMAENADYEAMKPRLRTLVTGAGDDTVETCMEMMHELYDELAIRGNALKVDHDERAVTRALAEKDERLRPRVMVVDECQNLFIGEHGKKAIEIAAKLESTARKYAITLLFLTPEPSKDALPRKLISISTNKACFAIGDQYGNDAVLGTGSYKSGISAVGLTPKTDEGPGDIGTCMARGFMAKPGLLRSYYVPQEDMHRVTKRAMQLREQHGIRSIAAAEPQEVRDLLEDVDEVLGSDAVPAAQVADALKARHPRWAPYQKLTGTTLRNRLDKKYGVKVPSTGNLYRIDPVAIREALARQSTADLDDED